VNANGNCQANPDPRIGEGAHEGRQALIYDEREHEGEHNGKKRKVKGWERGSEKEKAEKQEGQGGEKAESGQENALVRTPR
jgi:hypothetical protein